MRQIGGIQKPWERLSRFRDNTLMYKLAILNHSRPWSQVSLTIAETSDPIHSHSFSDPVAVWRTMHHSQPIKGKLNYALLLKNRSQVSSQFVKEKAWQ